METLDFISQGWMLVFGCAAIWLIGRREEWRRWGYLSGLVGQPAWLFTGFYPLFPFLDLSGCSGEGFRSDSA
jgi:hypothetical protein